MSQGRPAFSYEACIRCYCCQEMCPTHAIGLRTPWLVRLIVSREKGRTA
jgi:formate hydrogenlyase subunit 6/NADH:ubiquinone oxidoreductase subunit I